MRIAFSIFWIVLFSALNSHASADSLEWLAKAQEPDGHWDSLKNGASRKTDTATTGLALLAFLGAGHSEKVGVYKDNVKRAVAWLISKQDSNGRIFDETDNAYFPEGAYGHEIATLSICEAAAMANKPQTREAAQKAVNYCVEFYPLRKSTGTAYELNNWATMPILGWTVVALKSAKIAGLHVEHGAFDALISSLDSVEHKLEKAPSATDAPSEYWYRRNERADVNHPQHRLSAVGCLCRQFLGWKKEDLQASVEHFVRQSGNPQWGNDSKDVDLYYWYFATICVFQQGGETWNNWNEGLKQALVSHQTQSGDNMGMWDTGKGYASAEWGRVGETALGSLCLQAYYGGYPQLNPAE